MMRYVAILALAAAGLIRSPFFPAELTEIPAHELFYSAWGAAQLMAALYLLSQPKAVRGAWIGLVLAGGSVALMAFARLIDVPFTNTPLEAELPVILATLADAVAFLALTFHLGHPNDLQSSRMLRSAAAAFGVSLLAGGVIWGAALLAEPSLPDLAHDTVDQFEVFDQAAMLSATDYAWDLPAGFPVPRVPEDNPMSAAKVELGRHLFYDTRLSGNGTMACASCHFQELAFTDGQAVPIGSTGEAHVRNAQTLGNVAYNASYNWGNPVLTQVEHQVVIPLFGEFPVEMGITGNEAEVLARLEEAQGYQTLFAAAYPDEDDPISFHNVVQALSAFVRTLISGDSAYDRFVYQGDREAMSESALRGMELFLSETFECHHCHGGFNFSASTVHANSTFVEQAFFNTGLYNVDGEGAYPRGNTGVFEITGQPEDMGRFRPPSLRNIALTAPYMHDGSIATLEEVIDFYAAGGRVIEAGPHAGDGRANPFKSGFVPGFEINAQDKADLIAFLESLTDETFISDPRFSNPFVQ